MADEVKTTLSVDHQSSNDDHGHEKASTTAGAVGRGPEMPEILRNISPENLAKLDKKLRRRIDLRLMPMLIIMYILNYIDRLVALDRPTPPLCSLPRLRDL
jgi:hypothetical protein